MDDYEDIKKIIEYARAHPDGIAFSEVTDEDTPIFEKMLGIQESVLRKTKMLLLELEESIVILNKMIARAKSNPKNAEKKQPSIDGPISVDSSGGATLPTFDPTKLNIGDLK